MIIFQGQAVKEIYCAEQQRIKLLDHCLRKLNRNYLEGETPEQKAYGLIGGKLVGQTLVIELIEPLCQNSRTGGAEKEYMDNLLDQYAVPSETPLDRRGWVADPLEMNNMLKTCRQNDWQLVATYHMHRVPWPGDELRDTPTELDTVLAKDTELFMVIVSTVDPEKPVIRAFYEGYPDQEVPIIS